MPSRPRASAAPRWIAGVLVGILAVGVLVLAWLAYRHVNPSAAAPTPSVSATATPTPTPTATPTPTPTPEPDVDLAAQRYLVANGESSVWRAVAGSCADDEAPLVERSTDGGATFADVTPTNRGVVQVASLDPFDTAQAEMVVGVDDACAPQAMRTFTGGDFWESYDDVLAASTYVALDDPATVITPDGGVDAPCSAAWGLRTTGGVSALICDGVAYRSDDGWQELSVDGTPVAVALDGDGVRVATRGAAACSGVLVTRVSGGNAEELGCADDAPDSGAVALAIRGAQSVLWAGDQVITIG